MKAGILAALFLPWLALADYEVPREQGDKIETVDLRDIDKKRETLQAKVVKLRVSHRGGPFFIVDGGGAMSNIYDGASSTAALVPPEGVEWFKKLPEKAGKPATFVYAFVPLGGPLMLVGRELRTDPKGGVRITW